MMKRYVFLTGCLLWLGVGCRAQTPPTPSSPPTPTPTGFPPPSPAEAALLKRIPPELRITVRRPPTAAETDRARRLRDAFQPLHFDRPKRRERIADPVARMAAQADLLDEQTLANIRKIVGEGPIRMDQIMNEGDDEAKKRIAIVVMSMPGELLMAAARSFVAGRSAEGVNDLALASSYIKGNGQLNQGFAGWQYVSTLRTLLEAGLAHRWFSAGDRRRLLASIPTPEWLAQGPGETVKWQLEQSVRELAGLKAPRTDRVLMSETDSGWGSRPKVEMRFPPHGTLDREATFQQLIKVARVEYANATRTDGGFDNSAVRWVEVAHRGLPDAPMRYPGTDVAQVKAEVRHYVAAMNHQPNSLGRELLQASEKAAHNFESQLLLGYARTYRRLATATGP